MNLYVEADPLTVRVSAWLTPALIAGQTPYLHTNLLLRLFYLSIVE